MTFRSGLIFAAMLSFVFMVSCKEQKPLKVYMLSTEGKKNPLGVDTQHPLFSWKLRSDSNNVVQENYHILVASNTDRLTEKEADVWNSGIVYSDQSIWVSYDGQCLESGETYYWRVKVCSTDGSESQWSEPASFEMGLMDGASWMGALSIGIKEDTRQSEHKERWIKTMRMKEAQRRRAYPSSLLRKAFNASEKMYKARLYISAGGYFEAYLNGVKVGESVLDPAPSSYDKHMLYRVFDVTPLVQEGDNVLGAMLGNGFYGQNMAFGVSSLQYGEPRLKALLKIEYTDGSKQNIITDESWKVTCGPIVFDNVYGGETYDENYEVDHWNTALCDDANWQKADLKSSVNDGPLIAQKVDPMRKVREIKPKRIIIRGDKQIVEFEENIAGWIKLKIDEPKGREVRIRSGEAMYRDSSAINTESTGHFATAMEQVEIFVSAGKEPKMWEPRFTYHGFQYAEITGLSKKLAVEDVRGVVVHSDLPVTGRFASSDSTLNRIYDNSMRTLLMNIHGLPEDCPHREKCGWLGDAHTTSDFMLYSLDARNMYHKYLQDIKDNLKTAKKKSKENEQLLVPQMVAPGKRTAGEATVDWAMAIQIIPWNVYRYSGDLSLYQKCQKEIKDFTAYMLQFIDKNGVLANGLGDWCPPLWDRKENPDVMACDPYISGTALFYKCLSISIDMADVFKDDVYKQTLIDAAAKLKHAFNTQWLRPTGDNYLWYGSQTATVLALQYNMVPEEQMDAVVKGLVYQIKEVRNTHHNVGIHGNKHIYTLLSNLGYADLAYEILNTKTFPSYGYLVHSGVSTWPERQFQYGTEEWERSMSHPMNANFASYFYEELGGIRPLAANPGYKVFFIDPVFPKGLENVQVNIQSPYGHVLSRWSHKNEQIVWQIAIPANTKALVRLPVASLTQVSEYMDTPLKVVEQQKDATVVELGSGNYSFDLVVNF